MATRFYLPSSGASSAPTPPSFATWTETANADGPLAMSTAKAGTAMTNKATAQTATAAGSKSCARRYISPPLAAQTLTTPTMKAQVRGLESAANDNVDAIWIAARIMIGDGSGFRAGLTGASTQGGTTAEFSTSLRNKTLTTGALTTANVSDGDYIVIEIGFGNSTGGTSINASLNFGDNNANDLPENETETGALNPWVELSSNIVFQTPSGPPPQRSMVGVGA